MNDDYFTGGCQCGAIRFRVEGPLVHASICNCRMCQKAFGNFAAPFAAMTGAVEWTRGQPREFRSSPLVRRGFCPDCGTPLTYRRENGEPSLAIGAFDHPDAILPTLEYARDNRHPVFADYEALTSEPLGATDEERDLLAILRSFQHPDHDTETWSPGDTN